MEEKTYRQLLGLGRTSSDTAFIQKHAIVRSAWTDQDPLCLALLYAHHFGFSNTDLNNRYGIRRSTLVDIGKGYTIQRNRSIYMAALLRSLNDLRLRAIVMGNQEEKDKLLAALADLSLVQAGLATDAELVDLQKQISER